MGFTAKISNIPGKNLIQVSKKVDQKASIDRNESQSNFVVSFKKHFYKPSDFFEIDENDEEKTKIEKIGTVLRDLGDLLELSAIIHNFGNVNNSEREQKKNF